MKEVTKNRIVTSALMLPGCAIIPASLKIIPLWQGVLIAAIIALLTFSFVLFSSGMDMIKKGLIAGFVATMAYDVIRVFMMVAGLSINPFRSIELYGQVMLQSESIWSTLTGWIFHFWNGASFGAFYIIFFAPTSLVKALAWGIFLELALVATSPSLLSLTIKNELFASSFVGHIAFGLALHFFVKQSTLNLGRNEETT